MTFANSQFLERFIINQTVFINNHIVVVQSVAYFKLRPCQNLSQKKPHFQNASNWP